MAPVPRPPHRFWRWGNRWMTISRHPGSSADPRPSLPVSPTHCVPFARSVRRRLSPADARSELDPRSLDPAALFGARLPSLFEARRSLMTSATALTTCGQPNPGSFDPRRDGDLDLLPFLRRVTPSACTESDTWRAALRSSVPTPVLVPLACASLPNRDAESNAPPPRFPCGA